MLPASVGKPLIATGRVWLPAFVIRQLTGVPPECGHRPEPAIVEHCLSC
jgi:hypothetical protein